MVACVIAFNASTYLHSPAIAYEELNVTSTRLKQYLAGLEGALDVRKPGTYVPLRHMSLYIVDVRQRALDPVANHTTWK